MGGKELMDFVIQRARALIEESQTLVSDLMTGMAHWFMNWMEHTETLLTQSLSEAHQDTPNALGGFEHDNGFHDFGPSDFHDFSDF